MVLKRSKFGGNTGNTLRRIGRKECVSEKFYQAEYIIKENKKGKSYRKEKFISNVNHEPASTSNVVLSLGKNKSWDMTIKKLNLKNAEKTIIQSQQQQHNSQQSKKSKKKKHLKYEKDPLKIQVNYVEHTKKYFSSKQSTTSHFKSTTSKCTRKNAPNIKKWQSNFYMFDEFENNDFYHAEYEQDEECDEEENFFISYEDYFATNKVENKAKINNARITSPEVGDFDLVNFLCDNIEMKEDKFLSPDEKLKIKIVEFECNVNNAVIKEDVLEKLYGKLYIEGQSSPRKFLILKEQKPSSPFVLINVIEANAVVSKINMSIVSDNEQVINLIKESVDFYILIKASLFSVINIGSCCHVYSDREFCHFQKSMIITTHKFNVLEDSDFYNNPINNPEEGFNDWQIINDVDEDFSVCSLCDQLKDEFTTLINCGHRFCNDCWKQSINMNISNNEIECMRYKCNSKIDLVTICSLLPVNEFYTYCQRACDIYVSNEKRLKFCPSPDCENVACFSEADIFKFDTPDSFQIDLPLISCLRCRTSWCFNCSEKNHWPASCKSYKLYLKQREKDSNAYISKNGNFITPNIFLECKKCPKCNTLVEKIGGCKQMTCRCKHLFCWRCLNPLPWHSNNACIEKNQDHTSFFLSEFNNSAAHSFRLAMRYHNRSVERLWTEMGYNQFTIDSFNKTIESQPKLILGRQMLQSSYRLIEMLYVSKAGSHTAYQKTKLGNFINKYIAYVNKLEIFLTVNFHPNMTYDDFNKVLLNLEKHIYSLKTL